MSKIIPSITPLLYFVIVTVGLGWTIFDLCWKKKPEDDLFYSIIAYVALGLSAWVFLIPLFNVLHIPLHFSIFLGLAIIYPIIQTLRKKIVWKLPDIDFERINFTKILLFAIFALFLAVYLKGAFGYPYLEDDDPWGYAAGTYYISQEFTYTIPPELQPLRGDFGHYLEPYPPTMAGILAMEYQISSDMNWTLKFFNTLILSLHILFMFLLAKRILGSAGEALAASFVIAILPSSMSHFIWAHSLAMTLLYASLYLVFLTIDNKGSPLTFIVPILGIAAMMISQPFVSVIFGFMFITIIVYQGTIDLKSNGWKLNKLKNSWTIKLFIIGFLGVLFSMVFWGEQFAHYGFKGVIEGHGGGFATVSSASDNAAYVNPDYSLKQLVIAPLGSHIDQQEGFGLFVLMLVTGTLIILLKEIQTIWSKRSILPMIWFICFFLTLIKIIPLNILLHRFWSYTSLPLAMLAAKGIYMIRDLSKRKMSYALLVNAAILAVFIFVLQFKEWANIDVPSTFTITAKTIIVVLVSIEIFFGIAFVKGLKSWYTYCTIILLLTGLLLTSAYPKYIVQTSTWPFGVFWTSPQVEISGYTNMMSTLPKKTKVFSSCIGDATVLGFSMESTPYDKEIHELRNNITTKSPEEIYPVLSEKEYKYLIIETSCAKIFGVNETINFVQNLLDNPRFTIEPSMSNQNGFFVFRIS